MTSERQKWIGDVQERLTALTELLRMGETSTQDELCRSLKQKKFKVTQSTISRDLRRVGAIKTTNPAGEIVYRLPEIQKALPLTVSDTLGTLLVDITANENMVVIHTTPGSASLVARHLDSLRSELGILGTIAGDDTIFIAPLKVKNLSNMIEQIREEF